MATSAKRCYWFSEEFADALVAERPIWVYLYALFVFEEKGDIWKILGCCGNQRCSILPKCPNGNGTATERVFNGYPLKTR